MERLQLPPAPVQLPGAHIAAAERAVLKQRDSDEPVASVRSDGPAPGAVLKWITYCHVATAIVLFAVWFLSTITVLLLPNR